MATAAAVARGRTGGRGERAQRGTRPEKTWENEKTRAGGRATRRSEAAWCWVALEKPRGQEPGRQSRETKRCGALPCRGRKMWPTKKGKRGPQEEQPNPEKKEKKGGLRGPDRKHAGLTAQRSEKKLQR